MGVFPDFLWQGVDASRVTVVDGLQLQGEKPTTSMGGLEEVGREIERAIALAAAAAELERVVLVLEGLDFLVAATEIEGVQIENWALGMVLGFREVSETEPWELAIEERVLKRTFLWW